LGKKLSKEELEKNINEDAVNICIALKKKILEKGDVINIHLNDDDKVVYKDLMENIFYYCKDHLHLHNVPTNNSENFCFSQDILNILENCLKIFDPYCGKIFINYFNVCIKNGLSRNRRINLVNNERKISKTLQKLSARIRYASESLIDSGVIPVNLKDWKSKDITLIAGTGKCTEEEVKKYIIFCKFNSNFGETRKINDSDPIDEQQAADLYKPDIEYFRHKNFLEDAAKIEPFFDKIDENKKPYYRKLLTLRIKKYFLKENLNSIDFRDLNYSYIDKEYAEMLDKDYVITLRYPGFIEIGREFGYANPTQELDRFFEKVMESMKEDK